MDAAAKAQGRGFDAADGGDLSLSLGSSISSGSNIVTAANSMNMGKKANLMKELFGWAVARSSVIVRFVLTKWAYGSLWFDQMGQRELLIWSKRNGRWLINALLREIRMLF